MCPAGTITSRHNTKVQGNIAFGSMIDGVGQMNRSLNRGNHAFRRSNGGVNRRVTRRPGRLSASVSSASCIRATAVTSVRPRPAPGRPRLLSRRTKRSRMRLRAASCTPGPRSATDMAPPPGSEETSTLTSLAAGACLIAFSTKFDMALASNCGWPLTLVPSPPCRKPPRSCREIKCAKTSGHQRDE